MTKKSAAGTRSPNDPKGEVCCGSVAWASNESTKGLLGAGPALLALVAGSGNGFVEAAEAVEQRLLGGDRLSRGQRARLPAQEDELAVVQAHQPEADLAHVHLGGHARARPGDVAVDQAERPLARVLAAHEQEPGALAVAQYIE